MTIDEKNAAEAAKVLKHGIVVGPSTVRHSGTISSLISALVKAQAELKNPPKDSVNPHFKSKYADLATVRDVVIPVLSRNGLAVMQLPCELDDGPALTTVLAHTSGEWYETTIKLRPQQATPQGIGSALTYARRYGLQSIVGVAADDDDDGNAGSAPARQQTANTPEKPSKWALETIAKLGALTSREEGSPIYREYQARDAAGTVTPADRKVVDAAFAAFGERFPRQPAKA